MQTRNYKVFYPVTFKINKHIQFILLLFLGLILIYFSVAKINFHELVATISKAHFWIAGPVFLVSLFGYYMRSLRWKLLLESMQIKIPASDLFASLSIGYAVNIATPRLGEVARCLMLRKSAGVHLEESGISVVVERVIDIISLALIILLASMMQVNASASFIRSQILQPIMERIHSIQWPLLLGVGVLGVFILFIFHRWFWRWAQQHSFVQRAWNALKNIAHLKSKGWFFLYTIIIWVCYFLMTYLWFEIFDETQNLGLAAAFILMAVGSIGRSVPIQGGGMGAYHFLVSNAFGLFGIGLVTGNAMAFVIHGAQIVFTFVLGVVCWVWILIKRKNNEI